MGFSLIYAQQCGLEFNSPPPQVAYHIFYSLGAMCDASVPLHVLRCVEMIRKRILDYINAKYQSKLDLWLLNEKGKVTIPHKAELMIITRLND